jgi:phosphopantothenoylcysteine decarboxylase/phosphopantothenate--cysteine ligase
MVGFAAETQQIEQNGREKLLRKNLDMLFANDASGTFNSDSITATAFWRMAGHEPSSITLGPANKHLVARQMLNLIRQHLPERPLTNPNGRA